MKMQKLIVAFIISLLLFFSVTHNGAADELPPSYPPLPEALEALESDSRVNVKMVEVAEWEEGSNFYFAFEPTFANPKIGFIFYPGGLVDPRSYAPPAHAIADKGYLTVIVKMVDDLAVKSSTRADKIISDYIGIKTWIIGGHSLGGAMACAYAKEFTDKVQGVILWASFPSETYRIDDKDLEAISIYGTKDVLVDDIEASREDLPPDTQFVPIEGGNHTQCGYYDTSPEPVGEGDNLADITREEQQAIIIQNTVDFLKQFQNKTCPANLPKTGQTTCYDSAGTEIPCTGTGQDGVIQAGAAWPSPRFSDNGNGTVTDKLTGLIWTKNANLPDGLKTWEGALDYVAEMNAGTYPNFGYTDWRLPNENELESLINANESDSATWLNTQGFTNVQANDYWSSTSYAYYPDSAWVVFMWYGGVHAGYKSSYNCVWPVRARQSGSLDNSFISLPRTGQTTCYDSAGTEIPCTGTGQDGAIQAGAAWPEPRFTDNGDNTVTDNLTGLMWTQDAYLPGGIKTWQEALDYVTGMNAGTYPNFGYTDWRLPNRKELHSLTDFSHYNPPLPSGHPFINVQADDYWSSTSYAYYPKGGWVVNLWDGYVYADAKSGSSFCMWPVRGGQIQPVGCSTWTDLCGKYNAYVSGGATWVDMINCYNEYVSHEW